ncbi:MAG: dihydropteroate synthase, partial [Acidobacteriota bacterium]
MGILNVTPDSFADGGAHFDPERAVDAGIRMVDDGADIVDVGGESTRPGATPVGVEEEKRRVLPVVEALARRVKAAVSIDTYKADVADAAFDAGAAIVNDISGLVYDPALGNVAARRKMPIVLMHTRGQSGDMYREAVYSDP